jgi:hypothetical protein
MRLLYHDPGRRILQNLQFDPPAVNFRTVLQNPRANSNFIPIQNHILWYQANLVTPYGVFVMLIADIIRISTFAQSVFLEESARVAVGADQTTHAAEHDDGLAHNHHWATERMPAPCEMAAPKLQLRAGHAASMPTPSCVVHDDIHYGQV